MMTDMADITAIPILLSPDIAETVSFARALGFEVETHDNYAILRGYGIELHYTHTTQPEACHETSCYIRGGGIVALHGVLSARLREGPIKGQNVRLSAILSRPWGMSEFYLHDPHGNLLKFGTSTDELPAGLSFPEG
ncbi:VOC family protein [Rhodalgimonas zhirmunskyi]|uniref:VOC family protein n=1 Tax=Rhodalgimonas zhirmunskyi TaxID=2964767 RepID=A0AAJ1X3K2_9RHOB|nr:VOC family protein [Rhodoalgimonas zhirmunskyi]MDQ2093383.1 VOC family protein [Rhodoalgimonas zhirmunskyi]